MSHGASKDCLVVTGSIPTLITPNVRSRLIVASGQTVASGISCPENKALMWTVLAPTRLQLEVKGDKRFIVSIGAPSMVRILVFAELQQVYASSFRTSQAWIEDLTAYERTIAPSMQLREGER